MRPGIRLMSVWLGGAALVLGLAGGCETPAMQRARETREAAMNRSLKIVGSLDDHRSDNLAWTGRMIDERYRRDQEAAARNVTIIGNLIEQEFEHWAEKEPAYRRAIEHQLEGDGSSIERTVPNFVY